MPAIEKVIERIMASTQSCEDVECRVRASAYESASRGGAISVMLYGEHFIITHADTVEVSGDRFSGPLAGEPLPLGATLGPDRQSPPRPTTPAPGVIKLERLGPERLKALGHGDHSDPL